MSSIYTNVTLLGDAILCRGYENGSPISFKQIIKPTLFVPSPKGEWKSLDGKQMAPVVQDGARRAREFIEKYKDVDGFEVHGYERFVYQWISENYPGQIRFDLSHMKIITIDIEVACENGFPDTEACQEEMLLITIKDLSSGKFITWGTREAKIDTEYRVFWTEQEMLQDFHKWWVENTPDIVTGWNNNLYDIPYICRRIERVLGEKWMKSLSPWDKVNMREVYIKGRKNLSYDILGVSILDYLDLYRKFTYSNQESYRLDHIAFVELDQQKLDHSEFENFKEFYTQDWQKFVEYNIVDVELVDRLEDKLRLIDLCFTRAFDAKVNFNDIAYQVRTWDAIIYNYLLKKNIVIPQKERNSKSEKYAGAFVKEPIPGAYEWVVNFDLNSLYPHLIMQYNISPETLIEQRHPSVTVDKVLKKELTFEMYKDNAVCANGAMYRKDVRGFLPELMEKMYSERVIFKKKMIEAKKAYEKTPTKALEKEISRCDNIQMAKKIALNSAYGAIGNEYFRYYKLANAEAITLSGQVSIQWIEEKMNSYLNKVLKSDGVDYVIAIDTDSIYLNMGPFVDAVFKGREASTEEIVNFLDKVSHLELEKYIESSYEELADYLNAYENKMVMKRENIAERGIWTGKKRYILRVWDSEGVRYEKPKLKMMGIEAIKTSTPAPCRQYIKDALEIIMTKEEDDVIDFIENARKEFRNLRPDEIAFPRSVSEIKKWESRTDMYNKGCPIHVRGAILYNHYTKKAGLDKKYAAIQSGEKIKFCYLKTPNTIQENVFSFIQEFPKELDLEKYIDYDAQFNKSFVEPMKIILNAIGWSVEKKVSLESFFA